MVQRFGLRRGGVAIGLAVLLSAGVLSSCQVARVGAKCRSGFARNSTHVLICKKGKWARWMTIVDYLNLVKANQEKNQPGGPGSPGGPGTPGGPPVGSGPLVPVAAAWSVNGIGYASALIGSTAYIGGAFSNATDGTSTVTRGNLAAFDATTGALKDGFVANTNGTVKAIATDGTALYIGGLFTEVNGEPRSYLAKLDPTTGAVLPWTNNAGDKVYSLAVSNSKLYVGGIFDTLGGQNRRRAGAIDLASGVVDATFHPTIGGGAVNSISAARDDSSVYVAGTFTQINSNPHKWLARLDNTGTVVLSGTSWSGLESDPVSIEVAENGQLLVALGAEEDVFARYQPTGELVWRSIKCTGDTQAIHEIAGVDYGGAHGSCLGDPTYHLLKLNGITGGVDGGFKPVFDGFWGVFSISGNTSALVVAGDFNTVNGSSRRGFVIFHPSY